jgi:hypothetical protein
LAAAKGIDGTGPIAVIAPINQELIVAGDLRRIDTVIGILGLGGAPATKNGIFGREAVTFEADQIAGAVETIVAIALADGERVRDTIDGPGPLALAPATAFTHVIKARDGRFGRRLGRCFGRSLGRCLGRSLGRRLGRHYWFVAIISALVHRTTAAGYGRLSVGEETLETGRAAFLFAVHQINNVVRYVVVRVVLVRVGALVIGSHK